MKKSILTLINNNLKKCLIILILISVLNITAFILAFGYSSAICTLSFLSCMIAIYTISNVSGAKFGRLFNMHIIRWHYLRNYDKENTYQTSCLKYIAILLPVSAVWSVVNICLAMVSRIV